MKGYEYGNQIALACYDFIQSRCSPEDIRVTPRKDIQFFSANIESILDSVTSSSSAAEKIDLVYQISESLELELALKCLNSPVLEKKLTGH